MANAERASGDAMGHGLLCPACRVDLVMSERCYAKCRGVWLDRGELDKIIERSTSAEAQTAQAEPYASGRQGNSPQAGYEGGHGSGPWRTGKRTRSRPQTVRSGQSSSIKTLLDDWRNLPTTRD